MKFVFFYRRTSSESLTSMNFSRNLRNWTKVKGRRWRSRQPVSQKRAATSYTMEPQRGLQRAKKTSEMDKGVSSLLLLSLCLVILQVVEQYEKGSKAARFHLHVSKYPNEPLTVPSLFLFGSRCLMLWLESVQNIKQWLIFLYIFIYF